MTERKKIADSGADMQRHLSRMIFVVSLIAAGVIGSYIGFFRQPNVSPDPGDWGTLGDYFGGEMNPVVSFATLVVAFAVWKQQREELKATKEALEEQAKTAEQQRQEQRFFDLLNLYHSTVSSITLVVTMSARSEFPVQYSGKEAMAHFFRSRSTTSAELVACYLELGFYATRKKSPAEASFPMLDSVPDSLKREDLHSAWNMEETSAVFDHYLRVLFRVLAESESLLGKQHFKYVKLLRAQLSRSELMLIGLNLWLDEEGAKMIPLAEKYGILKHLQNNKLREQLQTDLPPAIFGRRFAATCIENAPSEVSPC